VGARFSAPVNTGLAVHPASDTMGNFSLTEVKRPERGVDHPCTSSAEVKERVLVGFMVIMGLVGFMVITGLVGFMVIMGLVGFMVIMGLVGFRLIMELVGFRVIMGLQVLW